MPDDKPPQIHWLEEQLNRPLHPWRAGDIADPKNRKCYLLDEGNKIIGLNLSSCGITDGSFLKELTGLAALSLIDNKISDGSFLKKLTGLTSLGLYGNQITDWSFLKELTRLTSLGLGSTQITDWSFLKELTRLTSLGLVTTRSTDWSFLKGMTGLSSLYLCSNQITDWSFLKRMTGLTSLSLYNSQISDGSFLKELTGLTSLNLSNNKISDGSFLKDLTGLTSLGLYGNHITGGSFLKELTGLTSLNLGNNQITDVSFLKELTGLSWLDLSSTQIADWLFLRKLTGLNWLSLGNNQITDGSFLKRRTGLTSLNFNDNRIKDWSFLEELTGLTTLNLGNNQITDVSFLKELTGLTSLALHINQIKDLSFLKELTRLTSLYLSKNQITDGSFLKDLTDLTLLDLDDNKITDWSFLKRLITLTTLKARNNHLHELPREFVELGIELELNVSSWELPGSIDISDNPFEKPPQEIIAQGHAAIVAWMADFAKGEKPLNEVKVILVGDGSAGKTTLRKRLMGIEPNPYESQTHGIQIEDFELECGKDKVVVHFWDFGGQEIMHATHQFFLSRRSLYILVLDGRKEEDADYWLKHIESFGGDSPILIALSKIDQNPGFEVNRKALQDRYNGIRQFFRVRCLDPNDSGIRELQEMLPGHLTHGEMVSTRWPLNWFNVKQRLQQENKPFIENHEFAAMCDDEHIVEEIKQRTLIRYLNDLGVALHFEDERLQLLQILNPRWATQAVYRIINAPIVATSKGLLQRDQIAGILKKTSEDDFDYPAMKHDYIIELMKKFELCYEYKRGKLMIPDLLDVQEPAFDFPTKELVRFRFDYEFLPSSIMPRLIVRLHGDIEGSLRWRSGVVLKSRDGNARGVIRSDKNSRRIGIEVEGAARRDYFAVIRHTIESIHDEFQKLPVRRKVPLFDEPTVTVDYIDLLFHEEKRRKTIIIGELRREYSVAYLLNGIEPAERRSRRAAGKNRIGNLFNFGNYYEGNDMSDKQSIRFGDNARNVSINQVTAEKIENSFNRANTATDKPEEIRNLLKQLAEETANIAEKLPGEKAEEVATDLEIITEQSTSDKPVRKYWELSKKGMIEAAEAVGVIGATAITLVQKLSSLLGF